MKIVINYPTDCDCWGGVKTACACGSKPVFGFCPSDSEGEAKGSPRCGRQAVWVGGRALLSRLEDSVSKGQTESSKFVRNGQVF